MAAERLVLLAGERSLRALAALCDLGASLVLAFMALVIVVEVLSRALLGVSTQVAEDAAGLGLVVFLFLGLPGAFVEDKLLRVDVLFARFSDRVRRWALVLFHLLALAVTAVYVVEFALLVLSSLEKGVRTTSALGVPVYLPQLVMLAGMVALAVAILLRGLATFRGQSFASPPESGDVP